MFFRHCHRLCLLLLLLTLAAIPAQACVGRILYIGAAENSVEDKILAEMLVLLINERTGTNVQVRYLDSDQKLYEALKKEEEDQRVDIIVENAVDALTVLKRSGVEADANDYATLKGLYDQKLDIIWLDPFGYTKGAGGEPGVRAPLLRRDVLNNFPLLPRILNKLASAIDDQAFAGLAAEVNSGKKPANVAKDFLRTKKLI